MPANGFHRFSHGHQDLVLAISYNLYGTRMATASSDHRLKVWDRNSATSQWTVTDAWIAHDAEVTDVSWNGPYVGEILGSVGEDGHLKVWQEDVNELSNIGRRFKCIFRMSSATYVPFMCLDFKNIGSETYLAMITRDGYLTICEPDDHGDLGSWKVMWQDYLCKTPSRAEETGFRLCWHHEKLPAWPAMLAGLERRALSLVVAVGETVKVYRTDKDRKFYTAAQLTGAKSLVRDVSWANSSARGFDMIATASKDGFIRIYELHTPGTGTFSTNSVTQNGDSARAATLSKQSGIATSLAGTTRGRRDESAGVPGAVKQDPKLVAELSAHDGAAWRVNFSQMGDLLASTGDDGLVRLWRKAIDGKWTEAAEIDAIRDT